MLVGGGDFTAPLADGEWVGTVTEIEHRSAPVRILVVRSFIAADMTALRTAAVEASLATRRAEEISLPAYREQVAGHKPARREARAPARGVRDQHAAPLRTNPTVVCT
jgi:hypothetical protein